MEIKLAIFYFIYFYLKIQIIEKSLDKTYNFKINYYLIFISINVIQLTFILD